jgi:cysteine synthase
LRRLAAGLPVPVLVKCEHMNPGGSVKDRIALAIVADAEARGLLAPGATLIEATAGNTGVGLALVAAARGYKLVCVMPEKMSVDKRVALATLGAQVIITPNAPPSSADNFRNVARRLAEERGWFLTDQFCNPANVRVHAETTAVEILEQTGGRIGAFVAGAGTGGTISGVGLCLKAQVPGVRIVLADPVGSALADWVETGQLGPDGSYAVEGIGGSEAPANLHRAVIDRGRAGDRRGELRRRAAADPRGGPARRRLGRDQRRRGAAGRRTRGRRRPVVTLLPDAWDRYRTKPWMRAWVAG